MRIQVIQYSQSSAAEKDGISFSPMHAPCALDDFDINILDLSVSAMWRYTYSSNVGQVDALPDLRTLQQMVENMMEKCKSSPTKAASSFGNARTAKTVTKRK